MHLNQWLKQILIFIVMAFLLTRSVMRLERPVDQARLFTGGIEYDYIAWTLNAIQEKAAQAQLNVVQYLPPDQQAKVVLRYFELVRELEITQAQINFLYTDPRVVDPEKQAAEFLSRQKNLEKSLDHLAALTEGILQFQVTQVLSEQGLGFLSQQVPPVLFHSTPLPKALIVSPRDAIRQEVNISLLADLSLEEITRLEDEVAAYMNASVLVEDVGGIGVYPTMVQRASSLEWTLDTIVHEWTHNYLTLRPLGFNYDKTPELRTMNETTASIVGNEISAAVLRRYYPQLSASGRAGKKVASLQAANGETFDFNHEMHLTRVTVDELLAQGKIDEAEAYMEERRVVFDPQTQPGIFCLPWSLCRCTGRCSGRRPGWTGSTRPARELSLTGGLPAADRLDEFLRRFAADSKMNSIQI